MRLSDLISQAILDMMAESESGAAEIKRNEFANSVGCVPSQINYVLSSRFTPENGFVNMVTVNVSEYAKIHFEKSVKKTLTIPSWLNRAALEQNINFSQVLQNALIDILKPSASVKK